MLGLFPGTPSLLPESSNRKQLLEFVTTRWPTNINVVPIDYAFRPRLRDRLTLRRLALRRNPWTFGDSVSHTVCRYSCQHSHFCNLQGLSRVPLRRRQNAPLPRTLACTPKASARGLSPVTFSARESLFRPVSCYAFFKGWLLLSQPPGCYGIPTSFHTYPRLGGLSWWSGLFPSPRWTLAPTV